MEEVVERTSWVVAVAGSNLEADLAGSHRHRIGLEAGRSSPVDR